MFAAGEQLAASGTGGCCPGGLFEFRACNLIDEGVVLAGTYRANEVAANPAQSQRLTELIRIPATHRFHLEGLTRDDLMAHLTSTFDALN